MTTKYLNKELAKLDYDYPWSVSAKAVLFALIGQLILFLGIQGFVFWRIYKTGSTLRLLGPIKSMIKGNSPENEIQQLRNVFSQLFPRVPLPQSPQRETRFILTPPKELKAT